MRAFLGIIALVGILAGGGLAGYFHKKESADVEFLRRKLALLEQENESLRTRVEAQNTATRQAADDIRRRELEEAATEIRGIPFLQPVEYETLTKEGIRATLEQKLASQVSDAELRNAGLAFEALGLLPENYPLKEKYLALLSEQLGAFYDQHEQKLNMFADATLDKAQNRIILVHELVHALQDQNYALKKFPLELKNNDDLVLATSSLIEGDATMVMNQYSMQNLNAELLKEAFGGMLAQNMAELSKAPPFLRETLLFPYVKGLAFCDEIVSAGGSNGLGAAFADPPTSTAQILHPEKYLAKPRQATGGRPNYWRDARVDGANPIMDNVLGELGVSILLHQWADPATSDRDAAGWAADQYLVFDDGRALIWRTSWETPKDADEFFAAMSRYAAKRFGAAPAPGAELSFDQPKAVRLWKSEDGKEVTLVQASSPEWAKKLTDLE